MHNNTYCPHPAVLGPVYRVTDKRGEEMSFYTSHPCREVLRGATKTFISSLRRDARLTQVLITGFRDSDEAHCTPWLAALDQG